MKNYGWVKMQRVQDEYFKFKLVMIKQWKLLEKISGIKRNIDMWKADQPILLCKTDENNFRTSKRYTV